MFSGIYENDFEEFKNYVENNLKNDKSFLNLRFYKLKITILHETVCYNRFKMTKYLLEKGADVNARDKIGRTPIICAGGENTKIIQLLIDHGAEINIESHGNHVLLNACFYDNYEVIELLLDRGADINIKCPNNESLFECLILDERKHIIDFILFYFLRKEINVLWELDEE